MLQLQTLWQFIKSNYSRFFWELVSVAVSAAIGYGASYLFNRATLEACQDERAVLLGEHEAAQAEKDSIKWSGRVALEKAKTNQLQHENNTLREQMALDSARRMSELDAMRAINQRYRATSGRVAR